MPFPAMDDTQHLVDLALKNLKPLIGGGSSATDINQYDEDNDFNEHPRYWGRLDFFNDDNESNVATRPVQLVAGNDWVMVDDPLLTSHEGIIFNPRSAVVVDDFIVCTHRFVARPPALPPTERIKAKQSDAWSNIADRITSYRNLEPDWDGYDGHAPNAQAISDALHFLNLLPSAMPPPVPGVAGDGEVGFHWRLETIYVEVSFYGDEKIIYHASKGDKILCAEDEEFSKKSLPRKLFEQIARLQGG